MSYMRKIAPSKVISLVNATFRIDPGNMCTRNRHYILNNLGIVEKGEENENHPSRIQINNVHVLVALFAVPNVNDQIADSNVYDA